MIAAVIVVKQMNEWQNIWEYALAKSPENNEGEDLNSVYDVIRDPEEITSRERSPSKLPVSGCSWSVSGCGFVL